MDELREKLGRLPLEPGVYLMKDKAGKVLYVGKAINLRSRVGSYFRDSSDLHPRTRQMVEEVCDVDFVVTTSETEALILEFNFIHRYHPRYNVRFKDDKRYPFIRLPVHEPYPPLMVVRRPAKDGARYFGPYTSTRAMWQTIRLVRQLFGLRFARKDAKRACSGYALDSQGSKRLRHCLDYYIGLCLGPCVEGTVTEQEYAQAAQKTIDLLEGRVESLLRKMREEMEAASEELRFEAAARIRDRIAAVESISAEQRVVGEKQEDADLVAASMDQDIACAAVFQVRGGRLVGQNHFFLEGITGLDEGKVLTEFVKAHYLEIDTIPPHILLAHQIEEKQAIASLFEEKQGRKIALSAPQKGEKRKLIELAAKNAEHYLKDTLSREGISTRRAEEALVELREILALPSLPFRIECYDISNLFGKNAVGSMVVFENGKAKKSDYRRFKIRLKEGQPDDFAMLREVLDRRIQAGLAGSEKFERMPDLMLVDGGKGQLNIALDVLQEKGLTIPTAGLAKEFEQLFVKDRSEPLVLPRHSRCLHLLRQIRDEAHRFAIGYHRALREGGAVSSILAEIPGIGPKRQQALLSRFASLEDIRQASGEELAKVPGISRAMAEIILTNLKAGVEK